jgi:hypothetical protein
MDEAEYADILKQVRDKEFEDTLHERLELVEQSKKTEIALAEANLAKGLQAEASKKDSTIAELKAKLDPARVTTSKSRLTATGTVLVEMPGTPSKPEQPEATPLTNEVSLSWDEPWNGGAFIDYYKVWVSLNADGPFELVTAGSCAGDIAPELRSCVVTGLTAGVTYYFAIIAHNVVGYSDRSLSISSTPLAAISTFEFTPTPSITGVAEVGRALVVVPGAWGSRVELSYQWFSGAQPILGAVGASYLVKPKDSGKSISVSITARKEGFRTVTKQSLNILASWPEQVNLVAISGSTDPGAILRAKTSELLAGESLSYQWQRDGAAIAGATQDYFEVSSLDVGSNITVSVLSANIVGLPIASVTDSVEILGEFALDDEDRDEKSLSKFAPASGSSEDLSAWTKKLADGRAIKTYAKNVIGAGKVQMYLNGKEVAWVRAIDATDPKLRTANGSHYLVRTLKLVQGKNVIEIYLDGLRIQRSAYTFRN